MTNSAGNTYYYITNYRGDVVKIVDGSGNEKASYSYDPWGKVLSVTEDTAVANQPLRYAGYVYDTETQLYYLQARYYDADTARFISRDPDGGDKDKPLTQNLYAYCNGDPVNNIDPDGNWGLAVALYFVPGFGQALALATLVTLCVGVTAYAAYTGYRLYKRTKAKDRRELDREKSPPAKKGTPRNNKKQNKQFDYISKGLSKAERRRLHDEITGRNLSKDQLIRERNRLFPKKPF